MLRSNSFRPRFVFPIVTPPGALVVRNDLNSLARLPLDIWVITLFVVPAAFIVSSVLRRCMRNNDRRRLPTPESSVSSEVASEISCEADTDGVDNNAGTIFEPLSEHIEAAPTYLDVAVPSPTLRFAPIMENTPDIDEASQQSQDSDNSCTPSISIIVTVSPAPEPVESTEPQLRAVDSEIVHAENSADLLGNTDGVTKTAESPRIDHIPTTKPFTAAMPTAPTNSPRTTAPEPVAFGYGGVNFLPAPHFQFDTWCSDEVANPAVLVEADCPDTSPVFDSCNCNAESTTDESPIPPRMPCRSTATPRTDDVSRALGTIMEESGSLDISPISNLEHAQEVTPGVNYILLDAAVMPTSADLHEASPIFPPHEFVTPTIDVPALGIERNEEALSTGLRLGDGGEPMDELVAPSTAAVQTAVDDSDSVDDMEQAQDPPPCGSEQPPSVALAVRNPVLVGGRAVGQPVSRLSDGKGNSSSLPLLSSELPWMPATSSDMASDQSRPHLPPQSFRTSTDVVQPENVVVGVSTLTELDFVPPPVSPLVPGAWKFELDSAREKSAANASGKCGQ